MARLFAPPSRRPAWLTVIGLLGAATPALADEPTVLSPSGSAFVIMDADARSWAIGNEVVRLRIGSGAGGTTAVLGIERAGAQLSLAPAILPVHRRIAPSH
jgi:hypothetical protein